MRTLPDVSRALAAGVLAGVLAMFGAGLSSQAGERLAGPMPAQVTAVVDGDTLEVRARIWLGQEIATRVRLAGIDAPEARSECPRERELAAAAWAFLADRLVPAERGGPAHVRLHDIENGKYAGRVLARVETPSGQDLAEALLAAGLVRAYDGGTHAPWCTDLAQ